MAPRPSRVVRIRSAILERRLAEEVGAALLLENEQRALDRADRRLRDIAVAGADLVGAVGDVGEQRLQILEVEKQQALLVGDPEGDVEHAFLRVGEVHQARQKQRPHFRDGGADRMALFAEQVPEDDRELLEVVRVELIASARSRRGNPLARPSGDAGEVALHVGAEDRHALRSRSLRPGSAASPSCRCRSRR